MSNEVTTTTNKAVLELDGCINTGSSVIQGKKLKFLDPDWWIEGKKVTGLRLTAIDVRNVVTKWGPK